MSLAKTTHYVLQKRVYAHEDHVPGTRPNELQKILTRLGVRFSDEVYEAMLLIPLMEETCEKATYAEEVVQSDNNPDIVDTLLKYRIYVEDRLMAHTGFEKSGFALVEPGKILTDIDEYCSYLQCGVLPIGYTEGAVLPAPDLHMRHEILCDEIVRAFCERYKVWDSMTFAPYVQFVWDACKHTIGQHGMDRPYAQEREHAMRRMLGYMCQAMRGTKRVNMLEDVRLLSTAYKKGAMDHVVALAREGYIQLDIPQCAHDVLEHATHSSIDAVYDYFSDAKKALNALGDELKRLRFAGKKNLQRELFQKGRSLVMHQGRTPIGAQSVEMGRKMVQWSDRIMSLSEIFDDDE